MPFSVGSFDLCLLITSSLSSNIPCTLYNVYFQKLMLSIVIPVHIQQVEILLLPLNAPISHGMLRLVHLLCHVLRLVVIVSQESFIREVCMALDLLCKNNNQKKMTVIYIAIGACTAYVQMYILRINICFVFIYWTFSGTLPLSEQSVINTCRTWTAM